MLDFQNIRKLILRFISINLIIIHRLYKNINWFVTIMNFTRSFNWLWNIENFLEIFYKNIDNNSYYFEKYNYIHINYYIYTHFICVL